ncbi:GNAT family N-acetyltransferase [Mesotoga sp.]|uniref:GNAT family N-acetyltransferase n=1 Tax=Mesotoga sp. TaxID=2053577 RepID=UPI00345E2C37
MSQLLPAREIAGFCTIWYDDVTRTGYYEPVGVVPEYHKRGLGKAMLTEGLRKLKRMGGESICWGIFRGCKCTL